MNVSCNTILNKNRYLLRQNAFWQWWRLCCALPPGCQRLNKSRLMFAHAGPARAGRALPDCNPEQQRPLPVGIIRAYTAHVDATDRGRSPGEYRVFVLPRACLLFYVCGLRKIAMATLAIELPDRIARSQGGRLASARALAQLFEDAVRRLKIMIPGSRINSEPSMPGRGVTR